MQIAFIIRVYEQKFTQKFSTCEPLLEVFSSVIIVLSNKMLVCLLFVAYSTYYIHVFISCAVEMYSKGYIVERRNDFTQFVAKKNYVV